MKVICCFYWWGGKWAIMDLVNIVDTAMQKSIDSTVTFRKGLAIEDNPVIKAAEEQLSKSSINKDASLLQKSLVDIQKAMISTDDENMLSVLGELKEQLLRLKEQVGDTDDAYPEMKNLFESA